jgi:hypothetical protein
VVALVVLVFAGLAWTGTISTLVAELELFLPRWVMARGMAIWTMIFTGCQGIGALAWGPCDDPRLRRRAIVRRLCGGRRTHSPC